MISPKITDHLVFPVRGSVPLYVVLFARISGTNIHIRRKWKGLKKGEILANNTVEVKTYKIKTPRNISGKLTVELLKPVGKIVGTKPFKIKTTLDTEKNNIIKKVTQTSGNLGWAYEGKKIKFTVKLDSRENAHAIERVKWFFDIPKQTKPEVIEKSLNHFHTYELKSKKAKGFTGKVIVNKKGDTTQYKKKFHIMIISKR